jgi:hypothetical protein
MYICVIIIILFYNAFSSLKNKWLKWPGSNLESFSYDSGLANSYDIQIYNNRVLNMYSFKNGAVFKIKNLILKTY